MPIISPRALVAIPALVVFIMLTIILVLWLPAYIALPVALLAAIAVGWAISGGASSRVLRSVDARPIPEGSEPRLESLVESICASNGIAEPQLYAVQAGYVDALLVGKADDAHLVVTAALLRNLDRLQLEAVVARQLSLIGRGSESATLLAVVAPLFGPLGARLRGRLLDDRRFAVADLDGVKLTRYPPALASTLVKAAAAARTTDRPASNHLWMIGPDRTTNQVQPPLNERIDTLREL